MASVIPTLAHVRSVKGPPQGQWTNSDWESLADDPRYYEVVDGVLYFTEVPSTFHQWMLGRVLELIRLPAKEEVLAFGIHRVGVVLSNRDIVEPDFVLVLSEHSSIIQERIRGVPDLIVEVLSAGSRDYDEGVKLKAYAKAGVPEYAMIDPEERQLRLYNLEKAGKYGKPQAFNEGETVTFSCLPTIPVRVSGLFEGAPDTTV